MGDWYKVIKKIKGHRYLYAQKTWREGDKVKTKSKYLGRALENTMVANEYDAQIQEICAKRHSAKELDLDKVEPVNTTTIIAYHGSPEAWTGEPVASDEGMYGAGFYLGSKERAELSATHNASDAAKIWSYRCLGEGKTTKEAEYNGEVSQWNLSGVRLLVIPDHEAWYELICKVTNRHDYGPNWTEKVQDFIKKAKYDGIEFRNNTDRNEIIVFDHALHQISRLEDGDKVN